MLHIVLTHCCFIAPKPGIFLHLVGFALGTNCAPTWANLVMGRLNGNTKMHECQHSITHFIFNVSLMMDWYFTPRETPRSSSVI